MIAIVFVTLFALAGAATYVTLTRRVSEVLGGGVAAILWGRLTPAAFNLTVFSGGSELSAPADGGTAILTATLAILMVVFAVGSAFDYVPDRSETRFASE